MEIKQKNYTNLSWLIYIAMAVIGFFLVRLFFEELNIANVYELDMNIYVYDALIILYGFISCGLVYNLGKMIFSLACGYELIYFNLYLIGFEKKGNKISCVFGSKYEFASKVLMAPKKNDVKTTLPLLGGTIASLFALGLTYLLIFVINTSATTKFFFLVSSMFYIFMILLNLIPCRMDSLNDGFSLFLLKEQQVKNIYLNNLNNTQAMLDGSKELSFLDIEVINHPLVLEAHVYNYYYLLSNNRLEEAYELASKVYDFHQNLISEEHVKTMLVGKVSNMCYIKENDTLKEYYFKLDANNKHIINEGKNLESVKTALYIFSYIDEDREGYAKIINDIEKAKKKYKYPRLISTEEKLIKEVIKDVQENKPEMNL